MTTMMLRIMAVVLAVTASITVAGCASVPPVGTGARSQTDAAQLRAAEIERAVAPSHAAIAVWYRQVGPKISKVETAVTDAQHAVRRRHHRGLYAACRLLRSRAENVRAARPAPDRIARHAFSREMTHLVKAADHCVANQLLAAGRGVNYAHYWSRIADNRVLYLLHRRS